MPSAVFTGAADPQRRIELADLLRYGEWNGVRKIAGIT